MSVCAVYAVQISDSTDMGLDQYAYVAQQANQYAEFWNDAVINDRGEYRHAQGIPQPREIMRWRKHPNLQGWMQRLWNLKGRPAGPDTDFMFNGVEVEITWEDLDRLEQDVRSNNLPHTTGFFFGDNADDHYKEQDLRFIRDARAELFMGLRVFYNSSW